VTYPSPLHALPHAHLAMFLVNLVNYVLDLTTSLTALRPLTCFPYEPNGRNCKRNGGNSQYQCDRRFTHGSPLPWNTGITPNSW
jgi:hypothetical protein